MKKRTSTFAMTPFWESYRRGRIPGNWPPVPEEGKGREKEKRGKFAPAVKTGAAFGPKGAENWNHPERKDLKMEKGVGACAPVNLKETRSVFFHEQLPSFRLSGTVGRKEPRGIRKRGKKGGPFSGDTGAAIDAIKKRMGEKRRERNRRLSTERGTRKKKTMRLDHHREGRGGGKRIWLWVWRKE